MRVTVDSFPDCPEECLFSRLSIGAPAGTLCNCSFKCKYLEGGEYYSFVPNKNTCSLYLYPKCEFLTESELLAVAGELGPTVHRRYAEQFDSKETKITLLTTEQAKKLSENILACGKWWWLRSPGSVQSFAAFVYNDGGISEYGYPVEQDDIAVRPAFKIANLSSVFGEKVYVGKLLCTVIGKNLVLADECVCNHRFDSESNDWEASELKAFIKSEAFAKNYLGAKPS